MAERNRVRITVWSDYVCPFCYLEEPVLEQIRAEYGSQVEIDWRAFELRPEPMPTLDPDGQYLLLRDARLAHEIGISGVPAMLVGPAEATPGEAELVMGAQPYERVREAVERLLELPNRVVMAPLTRNRAQGTVPGELNATYYAQRASAGLIISEATQVTPLGQGYPETPGIHSEEQIRGWRKVTDAVHQAGGRIYCQLWHVGRISHSSFHNGELPVAPSTIRPAGDAFTFAGLTPFETPRALRTDEIPELIEQFRQGAENAERAGFDGVEVHGANGYLLDQFLQSGTNQRTDQYGGSLENRVRLLLEITDAVIGVWGADRVGVRLSPGGTFNDMYDENPEETYSYVTRELNRFGLAYLHVVDTAQANAPQGLGGRQPSELLRPVYEGALIVNGEYTRESGEAALRDGRADLIAYGRLFLANPDLPERFAEAAELNAPDPSTFYGGGAEGYIDYSSLEEAGR